MNQFRRIVTGVFATFSGQLFSMGLGLLWLAIVVRQVSEHDFGVFVLTIVVNSFLITVCDFGMETSIVKLVAEKPHESKPYISTFLGLRLLIGSVLCIGLLICGKWLLVKLKFAELQGLVPEILFMFISDYLVFSMKAFLQGVHQYRSLAFLEVIKGLSKVGFSMLLLIGLDWNLRGLVCASALGSLVACVYGYSRLPSRIFPKIERRLLAEIGRLGRPLQLNRLLAFVFERTDILMLAALSGAVSAAVYEVGYKIPSKFATMFGAFKAVFLPHLAEYHGLNRKAEARKLLQNSVRLVTLGMTFGTLVAWIYHKQIMIMLFSETYVNSGIVFAILMTALCVGLCNYLLGLALIAEGKPAAALASSIPEAVLNVLGNLILIPGLGAIGAACASLMSRLSVNPILLLQRERQERLPVLWAALKSIVPFGLCTVFTVMFDSGRILPGIMIISGFIALNFFSGAIKIEDFRILKNLHLRPIGEMAVVENH